MSRGSMTVAGIASLNIIKTIMQEDKLAADGTPICCDDDRELKPIDEALERAYAWMARNFSARANPTPVGKAQSVLY